MKRKPIVSPNPAKRLFFLLLLSGLGLATIAQTGNLKGKLLDNKGTALPFANVTLLKAADTSFVAGALTDSAGAYSIATPAAGTYLLRFTAIGFTRNKTAPFEITDPGTSKDFGNTQLQPEVTTLEDVTVTALRPNITQLPDRMVVSVEGTAMAAGNNAFTLLTKAPGVFVDGEGNIQLNGRSGVTIMLDGRLTYLSARDLRTLLESMSAENIKSIEIITNPSSKYDAEGTAGILNINLKKNTLQGINGSVYGSINHNFKQTGFTAGGNIAHKKGRWNSFLFLDGGRRVGGREATFTRVFFGDPKTTYFDQVATGNFVAQGPPSVRLGTDYTLNAKHSVGFMAAFTTNTAHSDFLTETLIGNAPKSPYQFIDADNFNSNNYTNYTGNVHWVNKIDTLGTQISTDFDFVKITNKGEGHFYNYFTDVQSGQQTKDFLYTSTPNGYNIYSGKVDFVRPLKNKHKIEAGLKASHVKSDNDSRFYFANNGLVLDPLRTNHFTFEENIYAAYLNWSGPLSKKVTVQTGLRAEQTENWGRQLTTKQDSSRSYLGLFPTLFVQQKVTDNYGINWSYSRRLSRPNYGNLNPFRSYRDPYTWWEGNPGLRPQYTHVFSVAQAFKKIYHLTLSYQRHTDVITEVPTLDVEKNVTIYTIGNLDNGHNLSAMALAPIKITKKWDTQNTAIVAYARFTTVTLNGPLENDQVFYMLQSNHTIQLPKDFRMEVNMMYRGPAANGLYIMASMHRVDVALKKSFLKKKLDLTVNGNDLFKGMRYLWTTDINGNVNDFDQYFRFRSISATLRYNFSRGQKVETKTRSTIEEVNRL
ncbi:MAG: outer membrane beta-barrel protein [Chitinophagaceae bacterium]